MRNIKVNFSLQTNGMLITDEWAEFFVENNYSLGVSLDGIKDIYNMYRLSHDGSGSYDKVIHGITCLEHHNVPFNIMTVLTNKSAYKAETVLEFLIKGISSPSVYTLLRP